MILLVGGESNYVEYNTDLYYGSTLVYESLPSSIQRYWDYLNQTTNLANRTKKNYANAMYQLFNIAIKEVLTDEEELEFGSLESLKILDELIVKERFIKPIYIGTRETKNYTEMNKYFSNNYSAAIGFYKEFALSDSMELPNVYAIRTKEEESVKSIETDNEEFVFGGIYNYEDQLKESDVIFSVLGGDSPSWETGFKSIGKISREPYDKGYEKTARSKYFKIRITNKLVFDKVFTREDFYNFPDTINAPFIGALTKGEANQAIRKVEDSQIMGIIHGILDRNSEYYDLLVDIFTLEVVDYALNNSIKLIKANEKKLIDEVDYSDIEESNYINNWEQIIYYGAPGTGKSYKMSQKYPDYKRVTFHPEYSYTDFIGGLRPVQRESISYEFVSGPLTDSILEALKNPDKKVGIIIEEINRANTAAVFGDAFQLLDRDNSGWSEYGIINKEMQDYFKKKDVNVNEIKFPSNLSVLATMNNADQNIYVMDSAFKRRWGRVYMSINFEDSSLADENVAGFDISWGNFGSILNNHLSAIGIEEDKLIGQYFLTKEELASKQKFASKLLIYLWDDVVRYNRNEIFTETKNFSKLLDKFNNHGTDIFIQSLKEKLEGV